MQFSEKRNVTRWIIILASFVIVIMILWNTYSFFQIFKNEERVKMQNWALAQKKINSADPNADVDVELPFQIIQGASIPIIVTEKDSIINTINIDDDILKDKTKLNGFLQKLKNQNDPIIMQISEGRTHNLYYGDSSLLNKLKYYGPIMTVISPLAILFGGPMASRIVSPMRHAGRLFIITVAEPSITTPGPCGGTGEGVTQA